MYKLFVFLFVFNISFICNAQELNCIVKVGAQAVSNPNLTVFKTLEKSLTEFVNKTKWSKQNYTQKERIECSMFLNITSFGGDQFSGTIQVTASRPIFNSIYTSPIFNFNDKDLNFRYTEFENLTYNPSNFDSNLIAIVAFYANMIIGVYGDTFSEMGGTDSLLVAQDIAAISQSSSNKGWSSSDGTQNRYFLVNDMLSSTFTPIREVLFDYHFKGLDKMSEDLKGGKETVKSAINAIGKVNSVRPNAFLTRVFFDAKLDEIQSIFSGGPKIEVADLIQNLNNFSPTNAAAWSSIRN